jgi:shikimate dehydrogenase
MSKDFLKQLRQEIEGLDLEILRLLNERASVSLKIGKHKAKHGQDIHDVRREEAIFTYLAKHNKGPLKSSHINQIFGEIISISRKLQAQAPVSESHQTVKSGVGRRPITLTGKTSLYGIVGNPVAHSMSPAMHNTAFRFLGIDAFYLPFEVEDLPEALAGMKALGIRGASVTHPFKTQALALIDEVDDTAKQIGAVNTLVFKKHSVRGTNTDWIGAVKSLETLLPIKSHTFVVLGAGGAARAVVFGIAEKGGSPIVVNRTEEKGRALAKEFDCPFVLLSEIDKVKGDCLVNTTPVGMYPQVDEMPVPDRVLGTYKAVADVVYNPLETMLLKQAKQAGCVVASGFEMFVYQGVEQFTIWTGRQAPIKEMTEVVHQRLSMK